MPAWIPILKASLPYLSQIVSAAIPAFTAKTASDKASDLVAQQIAELQAAVTHNAEAVKTLATQLQGTLEGIDASAEKLQQEVRVFKFLAGLAVVISLCCAAVVVWVVMGGKCGESQDGRWPLGFKSKIFDDP
jgi:hypothetical protein